MNCRKLALTLGLLLLSYGILYGGITGKITGRVVEEGSNAPLPGVNVVVEGTTFGATTDLDGVYFILNVTTGVYEVKVSMIGYTPVTVKQVVVTSDLTTAVDFKLAPATLDLEEVIIVAERKMIQKDVTASRTIKTSDQMMVMPVDNVFEVVNLTAGTVGNNFRGGRATEVVYLVDGASIMDPVTAVRRGSVPSMAVEELSTETGGFSAEYSNAQSGIVNLVMKEGGDRLSGSVQYKTNDFGTNELTEFEHLRNFQGTLGGPVPFADILPGKNLKFFGAVELYDTNNRFPHEDSISYTYSGKLTYNITGKHKLSLSGFWCDQDYSRYRHLWSRTTYEDQWFSNDPFFSNPANFTNNTSWVNNNQLDTEDLNHNGILDSGEDLNGDRVIQSEDLNRNQSLSAFNMLDHSPDYERSTRKASLTWTHNLSSRTFYEVQLDYFYTNSHSNIIEAINEDLNGDGVLNIEAWIPYQYLDDYLAAQNASNAPLVFDNTPDPTAFFVDYNNNGARDFEDVNGNWIWDWNEFGTNSDLYYDNDDDDFIDTSTEDMNGDGILQPWEDINGNETLDTDFQTWEDMVQQLSNDDKDQEGFYQYGSSGGVYRRDRWYNNDRTRWHGKATLFSQVNQNHQIKTGVEAEFLTIFDHEVDYASGGNVYGQNYTEHPYLLGMFAEDKMEFRGMILRLGVRLDVLGSNFHNYPADLTNPVTDPSLGGEILNPTSIKYKTYVSPRFSIAFPFSVIDKLRFTYGKYVQWPPMERLFENTNYDLSGAFPRIGNPNLDPEITTLYEVGWEHMLNRNLVFGITGYYKDISGLTDVRQVFYDPRNWYGLYYNIDYGNVRGFEVSLDKRGNWLSGSANYTYSVAKGKSSSPYQNYITVWAGDIIPTKEQYLDWDQRHMVNANAMFRIPKGSKNYLILEDSGVNIIGQYGSGRPYSYDPRSGQEVIENNKRLPWTLRFDLRVDKRFQLGKYTSLLTFLQMNNVFDRQNVDADYFQQGGDAGDTIDPAFYEADLDGDGSPEHYMEGEYDDPVVWEQGRTFRLGFEFHF